MHLEIYTPNKVITKDDDVKGVTIPANWGQMCILNGHTDFITTLNKGQIKIKKENFEATHDIEGGFFVIKDNQATIMVEE